MPGAAAKWLARHTVMATATFSQSRPVICVMCESLFNYPRPKRVNILLVVASMMDVVGSKTSRFGGSLPCGVSPHLRYLRNSSFLWAAGFLRFEAAPHVLSASGLIDCWMLYSSAQLSFVLELQFLKKMANNIKKNTFALSRGYYIVLTRTNVEVEPLSKHTILTVPAA